MAGNQFPRASRLKRRRLIRPLFDRSQGSVALISSGVVQIRYKVVPRSAVGADVPFQIGFAPGRRTRTKVGRNRVRRVMREVFRLHQHDLANFFRNRDDCITMMVLFRGKEETAAVDLRRDIPEALKRLEERLSSAS